MIRIDTPQLANTQVGNPMLDNSAFAGRGQALGELAQGLAAVGDHFTGIALHAQKLKNAEQESTARAGMATSLQQFEMGLESDPDPDSRSKKRADFLSGLDSQIPSDAPPAVTDALRNHLNDFRVRASSNGMESDFRLREKRTKMAFDNELQTKLDAGDAGGANEVLDRAQASGAMLPEQTIEAKRKVGLTLQNQAIQKDILADPVGWLDRNPADKIPAGYNPASWTTMRNFAQGQEREKTFDKTQLMNDGIVTGHISTPEQIDSMGGDLRPSTREQLKQTLLHRTYVQSSAEEKARIASPEYQAQTVGQVSAMLQDYVPEADGKWDTKFVEMDAMVKTLPPGAVKDELTRNIDGVRRGEPKQVDTYDKALLEGLDIAYKGGRFGPVISPKAAETIMPTQLAIDKGFLKDNAKLAQWFSPDQIKEINAGTGKKGDIPATNNSREEAFRRLWDNRANKGDAVDPVAQAGAEAIANRQTQITSLDPAARGSAVAGNQQAQLTYGKAKTDFLNWLNVNKDATREEKDAKLFEISGSHVREKAGGGKWEAPPRRGETSGLSIKLSNYGYASDSTPDTNSKNGIGHADNALQDEKSAAISKSLADRLGLSHGDQVELTTTKGVFRVNYDDTVPSSDPRTGPLPETIDIYRKKNGSNGWSGTVTGIRKI